MPEDTGFYKPNTTYYPLTADYSDFDGEEKTVTHRFRRPTRQELDRAIRDMDKSPIRALTNLCAQTIHGDEKDAFGAVINDYPGVAAVLGNQLFERSGFGKAGIESFLKSSGTASGK